MPAETATESYPVRSYEVDSLGRLKILALCNFLQESAGLHARQLGVSVDQLLVQDMTWFLWRLHLEIQRLPNWGETVAIETWPAALGKPFAIRDFRLRSGGEEIGVATTAWLLMDLAAKRPIRRMPARIRDLHPDPPRRALEDRFRRLPGCGTEGSGTQVALRRSDLDLNGHLNHVAAIDLLLEGLPADYDGSQIEALEVEFRGEGHYGDLLESHYDGDDGADLHHVLIRKIDGKELVRGRSRWHQGTTTR